MPSCHFRQILMFLALMKFYKIFFIIAYHVRNRCFILISTYSLVERDVTCTCSRSLPFNMFHLENILVKICLLCSNNKCLHITANRVGGVMVSVLSPSVVYCGFEPRSGHTNDYNIKLAFDVSMLNTRL